MSCKLFSLFLSNYDTGVLAYVPHELILFFCSGTRKTLSVWGVLAVIKCIYLPPTYLYFMQDINDRCLLQMNSMSFVDLPFQEHWMIETHHMDQNPYIASLCPKPGVVSDNMTWEMTWQKARAQPTEGGTGSPHPLVGRPRFGANEITLSTRVMLSR
jgi:hypothetical protein